MNNKSIRTIMLSVKHILFQISLISCIVVVINNAWCMEFKYAECKPNCYPSDFSSTPFLPSEQIIEVDDKTAVRATVASPNRAWRFLSGNYIINIIEGVASTDAGVEGISVSTASCIPKRAVERAVGSGLTYCYSGVL